jgi:hypothetical protein
MNLNHFQAPLALLHPIAVEVLDKIPGWPGCRVVELASEADGSTCHGTSGWSPHPH